MRVSGFAATEFGKYSELAAMFAFEFPVKSEHASQTGHPLNECVFIHQESRRLMRGSPT